MIVVYDVSSGESFANVKRWLHEIEQNCDMVNKILGRLYSLEMNTCGKPVLRTGIGAQRSQGHGQSSSEANLHF